jgi:hypothetical protein
MVQPLNNLGTPEAQPGAGTRPPVARARSRAWIYYAILATVSFFLTFTHGPVMLLGAIGFGLYARYLYRGGRVVIWFW